MHNLRNAILASLGLAVVFDQLFWQQDIGLNLSLFAVLAAGCLAVQERDRLSRPARWTALGVLVSAVMLVVYGSIIAGFALCASLIGFTGFAHAKELRSHGAAFVQWLADTFTVPAAWLELVRGMLGKRKALSTTWRWGRLVILPLLVVLVYVLLYRGGNSRFNAMTAGLMDDLGDLLDRFFREVLTPHALFFLFGLVVCGGSLIRYAAGSVARLEGRLSDTLHRMRVRRPRWAGPLPMGALDRELRMGTVLLVLVNALLLVVNAIDIHWLWFGFTVPAHFSLKEFVHEGTWLLIISILLSIFILLYLFRNNLNFHPKARLLRILAFTWLAQNFVLGLSVFLRNYHYIAFHGLAYLRIGVIVFLVLMLVGLITLAIKIRERKSFFFLFRVNGWAAFTAMIALCTVDWDSTIARYNLHHWNSGEIDVDNYFAMSDKVLPLLYAELPRAEEQMRKHRLNEVRWVEHLDPAAFRADLDRKRNAFLERYAKQNWQEWTWADKRTYDALHRMQLTEVSAVPAEEPSAVTAVQEEVPAPTDPTGHGH